MPAHRQDVGERRHAVWGLTVLILISVLVVAVTIFLSGNDKNSHGQRIQLSGPTGGASTSPPTSRAASDPAPRPSVPVTTAVAKTSARPATSAAPSSRRTAPAVRTSNSHAADPCPSDGSCVVAGDAGVDSALNSERRQHGVGGVSVAVTDAAAECAAGHATCGGQYAQQNEPSQDGSRAVSDLLASPDSAAWLLSPATTSLAVGWAYNPSLRQYICVLMQQFGA